MARHKRHPWNKVVERMCDEANAEEDLGKLIMLLHRYGDYFLVEAIREKFTKAERLLDGGPIDTYSSRLTLLDSIGFFDKHECVLDNLKILNRLRNIYAHNVMIPKRPPENVKKLICSMKCIDLDGNECEPHTPWKNHIAEYNARVHICATDAIGFVQLVLLDWSKWKKRHRRARQRTKTVKQET